MNNHQKDIFEHRKSIEDSVGDLISYGKAFKKDKQQNQLSLFGTDDIEIKRPDIIRNKLSEFELRDQSRKEIDIIGLPITYDEFDDHILIEKTLCDSTVQEAFFCDKDGKEMTFLAKVAKTEIRTSRAGNKYAKVFIERNGVEIKLYLFGKTWQQDLRAIIVNQIHIIKVIHNNELYSIKKISLCANIPIERYIESISLFIRKDAVSKVNAYLLKNMVLKGKLPISYIIGRKVFESIYIGLISSKNCLELIDLGCEIKINKKR